MALGKLVVFYPYESVEPRDIVQVQDNVATILNEIVDKPHMDSFLLEGVELDGYSSEANVVTTLVEHKLGRKVRGWFVVDRDNNGTVWRDTSSTADLTKYLPLKSEAPVTIALVVF